MEFFQMMFRGFFIDYLIRGVYGFSKFQDGGEFLLVWGKLIRGGIKEPKFMKLYIF